MQLVLDKKTACKSMFWAWLICSLGAIYYCYEYFLRIAPSVITTELMRAFHLTGAEVGNLAAFYYYAYMPMQIVVGLLTDRYGPRRLLTFACILCAMGTYLFAGSQTFVIAAFGRFLVGFGSAFAFVGALKLATIWLPPNRFALVSGIIMCLGMIGAMAGDILLRTLVDTIGWHTTLYVAAVAGVALSIILWTMIRDINPDNVHQHLHVIDFKSLLSGLWGALKNPQIWINGVIGLLLYVSLSAFAEFWGPNYLEQAHGLSKNHAAGANSMVFLGWAIGAPFWGWFSDYIKRRCLPIVCSSIGALIAVCILLYVPGLSLPMVYILLFIFGFFSGVQILVFAICWEVSSIKIAGTAIALTNMIIMISGTVYQPLIGALLDAKWQGVILDGARIYPASAQQLAMSVLPLSILLAIVLTIFIRESYSPMKDEKAG